MLSFRRLMSENMTNPGEICCAAAQDQQARSVRVLPFLFGFLFLLVAALCRAADDIGPTLQLQSMPNPLANFMYFVPLISPQPVSTLASRDGTQSMRILSSKRHVSGRSFDIACDAELTGGGWQRSTFDLTTEIHRQHAKLENGGTLAHLLKSIEVQGGGAIRLEVTGTLDDGHAVVQEVRVHFNAHGNASPIWIDLCDVRRINGEDKESNEMVVQVNTLTFRRESGPPKMEVSVASVKHKDAGDGFWSNLKGRVAGVAANMLIDPLAVEVIGHQAMLDFGQALVSESPTFTFPRAHNLQAVAVQ
jgi:hypothetical protein